MQQYFYFCLFVCLFQSTYFDLLASLLARLIIILLVTSTLDARQSHRHIRDEPILCHRSNRLPEDALICQDIRSDQTGSVQG